MHNKPFVVRTSKNVIFIYKNLFEGRYAVEGKVVGTVSLTANDIPTKPTLTPCITQLFVSEKYRHKNIGQSLVEFAEHKLRDMGFQKTYLYTTSKTIHEWYAKLGWKIIEEGTVYNINIKIMERGL